MMSECIQCGKKLSGDEIAICRKLIHRETKKFLCKSCLADYFSVQESVIDQKILRFKEIGCQLFVTSE